MTSSLSSPFSLSLHPHLAKERVLLIALVTGSSWTSFSFRMIVVGV